MRLTLSEAELNRDLNYDRSNPKSKTMITRRSLLQLATLASTALCLPARAINPATEDEQVSPDPEQTADAEKIEWLTISVSTGDNEQAPFYGCTASFFRDKEAPSSLDNRSGDGDGYEHVCSVAQPRANGRVYFEFSANGKLLAVIATPAKYVAQRRFDVIKACMKRGRQECLERLDHAEKFGTTPFMIDDNCQPIPTTPTRKFFVRHDFTPS